MGQAGLGLGLKLLTFCYSSGPGGAIGLVSVCVSTQ